MPQQTVSSPRQNPAKAQRRKQYQKILFQLGLFFTKPLIWTFALLIIADGCGLALILCCYGQNPLLVTIGTCLFTAFTTAILLLITGLIYKYCTLKLRFSIALLEDSRQILVKMETGIRHHLQQKQEKKYRKTVTQTLTALEKNALAQQHAIDHLQQTVTQELDKVLSNQNQTDNLVSPLSFPEGTENRLKRLVEFLAETQSNLLYLQQVYEQIQQLGFISPQLEKLFQQTVTYSKEKWQPIYEKLPAKIKQLFHKIEQCAALAENTKPDMETEGSDTSTCQQEALAQEYETLLQDILQEITTLRKELEQEALLHLRESHQ